MLHLKGKVQSLEQGKEQIQKVISNGDAMEKFKQMLLVQGVTKEVSTKLCGNPKDILPLSKNTTDLIAPISGTVTDINALDCAHVSSSLGAGRFVPSDNVTHDTGLHLHVACGDHIEAGKPWVTVYHVEKLWLHI